MRVGDVGPKEFTLPADAVMRMRINAESEEKAVELSYTVKNFVIAPGKGLPVNLAVAGQLTFDIGAEISDELSPAEPAGEIRNSKHEIRNKHE